MIYLLRAATIAAIITAAASAATAQTANLPPGLTLGSRTLTHADTYARTGEAVVTATTPQGSASKAALWIESPASNEVATGDGEAVLRLDTARANDNSETVIVHDAHGSQVVLTTRPFLTQTIRLAVQVDGAGRLLALPTVRLAWDHSRGVVTFTRDNAFAGPLTVVYRVFDLRPGSATVKTAVIIPTGTASVDVPQSQYGFVWVAYAGRGYTVAPDENNDMIEFF